MGLFLFLVALAGLGFWAYKSVRVRWVIGTITGLGILTVAGAAAYSNHQDTVRHNLVKPTDMVMTKVDLPCGGDYTTDLTCLNPAFTAEMYNPTTYPVDGIVVHIESYDCPAKTTRLSECVSIDQTDVNVVDNIPAHSRRSLYYPVTYGLNWPEIRGVVRTTTKVTSVYVPD